MTIQHRIPQCNLFQRRDQQRRRVMLPAAPEVPPACAPSAARPFVVRPCTIARAAPLPLRPLLVPEHGATERIRAQEYAESPGARDIGPDGGREPDMAEISHMRTRLHGPSPFAWSGPALPPSSATSGAMRHRSPARRSAGDSRGSHPVHRLPPPAQHGRLSASGIHVAKG
jgi:hypothetical protein